MIIQRPLHFHYGVDYDGTYDNFYPISISSYLGTNNINFKNKERLLLISVPYDILLKGTKFKWFLELSEKEFNESNLQIRRILHRENI